ncbi:MAG: 3-phosphoshikimate 1-carboxyvinyltransferase [Clostridia bacterium]|nr:3-phosphoshikimate 1-carboxyvinyltransferase [Clostridia bacterium]
MVLAARRRNGAGPSAFDAAPAVPGDKSITHRAVLLGALARGTTVVANPLDAGDTRRSLALARAAGAEVRITDCDEDGHAGTGAVWRITGAPGAREAEAAGSPNGTPTVDCGNSGTTMRLGLGLLAGRPGAFRLTGDDSLRRRPMLRVVAPLRAMGAEIRGRRGGELAPLTVRGGRLRAVAWRSPVASAQVKSAVLLAGLQASGRTVVLEPTASRDHTERMLAAFGAPVERELLPDGTVAVAVEGGRMLRAACVTVPADLSAAAFFFVAAAVVPGARATVRGVGVNPTRAGLLEVLKAAGAEVHLRAERQVGGEPVADVTVTGPERLRPFEVGGDLVPRLIDEIPALAVAALAACGTSVVRDAAELRVKETDRIRSLGQELAKLGARVEELPDGLRIEGGRRLPGGSVSARGDHRLAMAFAVLALLLDGPVAVEGFEAVAVSFPGFLRSLAELPLDVRA